LARLAAAAVFIAAMIIGVTFYLQSTEKRYQDVAKKTTPGQQESIGSGSTGSKTGNVREELDKTGIDEEITKTISLVVSDDIDGLVKLLEANDFSQKPMVARCLGQMGDERALAALHSLDLAALESGLYTEENSPYAQAIAAIEARLWEAEDANDIDIAITERGMRIVPEKGFLILEVLDGRTGKPVDSVVLDIQMQRDGSDEQLTAATDSNGIYKIKFSAPMPRFVNVTAKKDGFVPVAMSFGDFNDRKPLPETYVISLDHGTSIGGVVKNEMSEPVEGATVYLYVPGSKQRNEIERTLIRDYAVKTDVLGRWKCNSIPDAITEVQVRLSHPDYVNDEYYNASESPTIESLRDETCEFILKRGSALSGKVLDLQGQSIKGALVFQGANRSNSNNSYPQTTTADDGSFIFKHCNQGEIILTVQAAGYSPDLKKVVASPDTLPVEFRLGSGCTIRGRVFDIDNNSISGVTILLDSWRGYRSLNWRTETDAEGHFEWTEAPPDEVIVNLFKGGYMTIYNMPMSPLADEYRLTMYPPLKIKGMVNDAQTGEPVRNFRIVTGIRWGNNPNIYWSSDQKSAEFFDDGGYECEFIYPSESHFIRIEADGYLPQISRDFGNEEGTVIYNFILERGVGLSGRVYLEDGVPALEAEVIISTDMHPANIQNGYNNQKRETPFVKTNELGEFFLPPQTEDYQLVVIHDSGCAQVSKD
ncbi:MAG: carboxypeptidase regulatory-like domain-containing protein, partial [Candidatus Brocadiia bacterium]